MLMATPAGLKPATPKVEALCSIQLSYGAIIWSCGLDLNQRSTPYEGVAISTMLRYQKALLWTTIPVAVC